MKLANTNLLLSAGAASLAAAQYTLTVSGTAYPIYSTKGATFVVDGETIVAGPPAAYPTQPNAAAHVAGVAARQQGDLDDDDDDDDASPTLAVLGTSTSQSEMIFTTVKPAAAGARGARGNGKGDVVLVQADFDPIQTIGDLAAPDPGATSAALPSAFSDDAAAPTGGNSVTDAVGGANANATDTAGSSAAVTSSVPATTTTTSATATATAANKKGAEKGGAEELLVGGFFPGGLLVALGVTIFYLL